MKIVRHWKYIISVWLRCYCYMLTWRYYRNWTIIIERSLGKYNNIISFSNIVQTDDETVEGLLFIRGTTTQIETLRKIETENYSIKEIDIILGKILSEPSFSSRVSNMFDSNWDIQSALKFINQNVSQLHHNFLIFSMVFAIILFLYFRH